MPDKIIAGTGATGTQGGGLVRAILADPERRFTARAMGNIYAHHPSRSSAGTSPLMSGVRAKMLN